MTIRFAALFISCAFLACGLSAAHAERRVALVIGNSAYSATSTLPNSRPDAVLVASTLKSEGFEVTLVQDAARGAMLAALNAFNDQADQADWALVYYAGHGIEIGGVNYLLPTDVKLAVDRDAQDEAVPLDRVLDTVANAKKLRLVVLDACRNNPFSQTMRRSVATRAVDRGLKAPEPQAGIMVFYAAAAGQVADDGATGHSPFTTAFVKRLQEPGLEVSRFFNIVTADVIEATARRQRPFEYGSNPSREEFYFKPPVASPIGPSGPSPDEQVWAFLKSSKDVAVLTDFRDHLPPNSPLRGEVEARLKVLQGGQQIAVLPPEDKPNPLPHPLPPHEVPVPLPALSNDTPLTRHYVMPKGANLVVKNDNALAQTPVAFSPDGRTALSGNADGTLTLWDVVSGKMIRTFAAHHTDEVLAVAFSPDGQTALSGSKDHTLKLWNVASGTLRLSFDGHNGSVAAVAFSPDGRNALSGSADKTLKLWDIGSRIAVRTFSGHADLVGAVAFSPDGRTALSGSWDTTLKLWDVAKGTLIRTFTGHSYEVYCVAFSSDGHTALSGSGDSTLKLWDLATGSRIRTFNIENYTSVHPATFSPDGKAVLSGSLDSALRLWDVTTSKRIRTFLHNDRDQSWLVLNADDTFATSGDPRKFLAIMRGKEVLPMDEFIALNRREPSAVSAGTP